MKSILIVTIVFVLLIPIPAFAQSSSQQNNCPDGMKAEVNGVTITCVPISDVKRTCPHGSYQGLDNQGNFACRDIDSNNLVDPKTGLMYDSQTGELIQEKKQTTEGDLGFPKEAGLVLVAFAIIATIILLIKQGPYIGGSRHNPPSMKQLAILRDYSYDGPMPTSSREAWKIIADLKRGGDGFID